VAYGVSVNFFSMIEVKNLIKKYGNLAVVNDVSMNITKGELVAITGPSGAGKSTLLHLIGALDLPDSGSVYIDGENLVALSSKKQAKFRNEKIGFVFQFHHLLPEFSAIENVAMPLWIAKKRKRESLIEAAKFLDIVGLSTKVNNKPSELSGGEQQRVAIARALINRPSVVMADEPTGNLDSANADSIHQLFLQLRKDFGQTFILVTHNKELAALADRNLEMLDGRMV
jgi:lipoprotein-releasing system ATP-binding protein